jgi:hypothetical protein
VAAKRAFGVGFASQQGPVPARSSLAFRGFPEAM